jgi:hypothetical protein
MVKPVTSIDLTGPFFEKDPALTLRQNIRAMLAAMAAEGEADVRAQAEPKSLTGAFAAGVKGRVDSLTGKPWHLTAIVSQTHVYRWPKGGPKGYRGGKHEKRHGFFKRTGQRLRRSRAVNTAELVKGLT